MQSPLECQALCSSSSVCQVYFAYYGAGDPQTVYCRYGYAYNPNLAFVGISGVVGIKGMCSAYSTKYNSVQQAACYDSPLIIRASARARARRSIPQFALSSVCSEGETSCPIKKVDGTFGSGHECINIGTSLSYSHDRLMSLSSFLRRSHHAERAVEIATSTRATECSSQAVIRGNVKLVCPFNCLQSRSSLPISHLQRRLRDGPRKLDLSVCCLIGNMVARGY